MKLTESLQLALKNIRGSKMRTFLTMLGIIIGVTAVIVIVGLGNGLQRYMTDSFAELGTNLLQVSIVGRGSSRSVSEEDMYALKEKYPDLIDGVSPGVNMRGTIKFGTETADTTSAIGVSEEYLSMRNWKISQGRGLEYVDMVARKPVCVVGTYVAEHWFNGDAVGKTVKISGSRFTIVGVMAALNDEPEEGGSDDCIFVPYTTAARHQGTGSISAYLVTITDEERAVEARKIVEDMLYEVFRSSDYYDVMTTAEMLDMMNQMIGMIITILAVIAAISLVVGGIGIMNIMLVSVTERTREIGIRKALGAKERYIMQQFVIEAATTSALGGAAGILLGYLLSSAATVLLTMLTQENLSVTPTLGSITMAVGVSVGIGVIFGYLPAKKAARLNPIDALHYD